MNVPESAAGALDVEAVRAQLQRIVASDGFASAPILDRLLRYVVESCLCAPATPPKEYTIGVEVLQRGAGFDPAVDTIVRVHFRRLRRRLASYYENEGRTDSIRIVIPKGHYQAEFIPQSRAEEAPGQPSEPVQPAGQVPAPWRREFRSHSIPAPRTPLVGRAGEVAELLELLTDDAGPRLVTLTGAAGSGKTRLAVEAGLRWQAAAGADVIFIALANVTDARTLQLALLRALGLSAVDSTPPMETMARHLRGATRAPHLILDNFEQLAGAAPLIGSLLDACISLKALVTSRVALHLYGECEYPVLPLALPGEASMTLERLRAVPALELFVQRAATVRQGFSLAAENIDAVMQICRRCDGLPLGIELAAAQCRALSPDQLLERFPEQLDVPAGNVADIPERQRTLRHAIDWSHALLGESERRLFRRLAVFAGGFTLEAAEAVANVRGDLGVDVAEGAARLLDHNLLQREPDAGEPRFTMLETIRSYALEQLLANGESDDIGRAHAAWCLVLAEEGSERRDDNALDRWVSRCELERDDFRAALEGLLRRGDAEWAMRLVLALYRYWERGGYRNEARNAQLAVLRRFKPSTHPAAWARVACCVGAIEGGMGKGKTARTHIERGLAVARAAGDKAVEIMALTTLAVSAGFGQRYEEAAALFGECLRLCEASASEGEIAAPASNLAVARLALGRHEEARRLLERALASFRKQKEWTAGAWCINQLGDVEMVAGRPAEAQAWYQRGAREFLELGDFLGIACCWTDLGQLALQRGDRAGAASLFADALRIYGKQGFQRGLVHLIEGCAELAVSQRRCDQALVLAAVAAAVRSSRKMRAYPYQRARFDAALEPARNALTPAVVRDCRARGAALDAGQAVEYVRRFLADVESDEPSLPARP